MIEFRDVTVRAGQFELSRVSFMVERGQYAVLMGRTGGGKSTLLEALCGLRVVTAGSVWLGGRDVTHADPADRGIGYVPQDLALFPSYSVREHLAFALKLRQATTKQIDERIREISELLGIAKLLSRGTKGLSGGEAQRVALGRALSFHPSVLLLDEPLSALDEETREEMHILLKEVQRQTGVTTLHVTHSLHEAETLSDRTFVLEHGLLREEAKRFTQ